MPHAIELLLRVYLCLTSNAISFLLPSHAFCMCHLSLTAICYNRSYLMIANAKICHTCSQHVHFANRMQLPAAGCLSHTEYHTSVRASPLTADLEPPWTVFVHDCIARRISFQERLTLPNIPLLASTSCVLVGAMVSAMQRSKMIVGAEYCDGNIATIRRACVCSDPAPIASRHRK